MHKFLYPTSFSISSILILVEKLFQFRAARKTFHGLLSVHGLLYFITDRNTYTSFAIKIDSPTTLIIVLQVIQ